MVEKEALREKEAETIQPGHYEASMRRIKEHNKRVAQGRRVIKGKFIPWEQGRQGLVRYYVNDFIKDTANDKWSILVHEIRVHSGKHTTQGGFSYFVLKGQGYTVVDGVRFDWGEGDLVCLAIKVNGVEHQHFNLDDKPSRWVALINHRIQGAVGRFMEQKADSPDWIKMKQK